MPHKMSEAQQRDSCENWSGPKTSAHPSKMGKQNKVLQFFWSDLLKNSKAWIYIHRIIFK